MTVTVMRRVTMRIRQVGKICLKSLSPEKRLQLLILIWLNFPKHLFFLLLDFKLTFSNIHRLRVILWRLPIFPWLGSARSSSYPDMLLPWEWGRIMIWVFNTSMKVSCIWQFQKSVRCHKYKCQMSEIQVSDVTSFTAASSGWAGGHRVKL